MDWKLTKAIYIIVFLLLNIFVVYMLINKQSTVINSISSTPNILENTQIDMSDLPNFEKTEMNVMTGKPYNFIQNPENHDLHISTDLAGMIDIGLFTGLGDISNRLSDVYNDIGNTRSVILQYIHNNLYQGERYIIDEANSTEFEVILNQTYQGYPIFNHPTARIVLTQVNSDDIQFEQSYITNIEDNTLTSPESVRTPVNVVTDLYSNQYISEVAIVHQARLGYYIILNNNERVVLRPKWSIVIEDQGDMKTFYVDAISITEDVIEESE